MARTKGMASLAVAAVGAGAVMVYSAIMDVPPVEILRILVRGGRPEPLGTAAKAAALQGTNGAASADGTGNAQVTGREHPHVRAEMEYAASTWGVRVYGWRAVGSVPGSDHPRGLAMDAMVYTDRAKGDMIAMHYVANAQRKRVKYVIWFGRIWTSARGWHTYIGPNAHKDHVHVSFYPIGSAKAI